MIVMMITIIGLSANFMRNFQFQIIQSRMAAVANFDLLGIGIMVEGRRIDTALLRKAATVFI